MDLGGLPHYSDYNAAGDFSFQYEFTYNTENNPIFNNAQAFFAIGSIALQDNSPPSYNLKTIVTMVTSNTVKLEISKKNDCKIQRLMGKIVVIGLQNGMLFIF